jgi:porphobilinogen deaminase
MDAMVGSVDGTMIVRDTLEGDTEDPVGLGERMVESLLAKGAHEILEVVRAANDVDDLLQT